MDYEDMYSNPNFNIRPFKYAASAIIETGSSNYIKFRDELDATIGKENYWILGISGVGKPTHRITIKFVRKEDAVVCRLKYNARS